MTIEELILECLEALHFCENNRFEHRRQISLALTAGGLPEGVKEALRLLDERLGKHNGLSPWSMFESTSEQAAFKKHIYSLIPDTVVPQYVYHGTTAGRLPSIHKEGLIPGKEPVWKGGTEHDSMVRQNSDGGVFFSSLWRNAMHHWARAAHHSSKGPKASIKRAPAVIRIRKDQLPLEVDPAATQPSLMVRGVVPVDTAEVIIGFDTAFPIWRPLGEIAQTIR